VTVLTDRALVLTRHPWSESSLVVHALTRAHGRVHLLARGAYRTTSRYFAVLDLFDELEIEWDHSPRRELQNLRAGSIATRRRRMRTDLAAFRAGVTVLELSDLAARHDTSDTGLFSLANGALTDLEGGDVEGDNVERGDLRRGRVEHGDVGLGHASAALSLVRFELAFLLHLGLAPALLLCAACGGPAPAVIRKPHERAAFSAGAGGRLCRSCADEARAAGRRVGTLPVAVLEDGRRIAESDARISLDEQRTERVRDFVGRFLDYHLETRPRSQRAFLAAPNRNAAALARRPGTRT
jgi:recombinational DNA repair protein (RecF pathway)